MINKTSNSVQNLKHTYLTVSARKRKPTTPPAILSEEFAIVTCSLLIAAFAIVMLIVMQTLAAVTWGSVTIWQLLNGKGLFNEGDDL